MTPRDRALLYSPPLLGLTAALLWALLDKALPWIRAR